MIDNLLARLRADMNAAALVADQTGSWKAWNVEQTVRLLQQYPAGISHAVLCTELEHKWRMLVRRGEHSGKLKQIVSALQLSLSDVIIADVNSLDEYRCILSADGVQCTLIVHRQWCDWTMYLASAGISPLTGRRCALTHCRLLKSRPPVLLPTSIAMFLLRMENQHEAYLVQDIFQPLYSGFWAIHVRPFSAGGGDEATLHARLGATLSPAAAAASLPDNAETLALFAEVLGYSELRSYESSSSSAQYRLVALRLEAPLTAEPQAPGEPRTVVAYMILFDEQEALCALWSAGDRLLIFRPYLRANAEETFIFGGSRHSSASYPAHTLQYQVTAAGDDGLFDFVPEGALFVPFHLLYGSVTVVSRVEGGTGPGDAQLPVSLATAGALSSHAAHTGSTGPTMVRLISCSRLQAGAGALVELWAEAFRSDGQVQLASGTGAGAADRRLLHIRADWAVFETVCGSGAGAALSFSSLAEGRAQAAEGGGALSVAGGVPSCRPGRVLFLSGLRVVHRSSGDVFPAAVVDYLAIRPRGAVATEHCAWGLEPACPGASLFPEYAQSALAPSSDRPARDCAEERRHPPLMLSLSSLPALACSPSLFQPVPISAALAETGTAGAGCVLVSAQSLQPMHPSVRLCDEMGEGPALDGMVGQKRSFCAAEGPEGPEELWGYQVMRLRDSSGEVLCIIESVVVRDRSGVVQVKQHLVNTSSSFFFDPASGQMTRLSVAEEGAGSALAGPHLSVLLSRVDDVAPCPALRQLRSRRGERPGTAASAALPAYRVEAICDAHAALL